MKVALVHDWYTVSAGGEKVMRAILNSFTDKSYLRENPFTSDWEKIEADKISIFSLIDFLSKSDREYLLNGRSINASFIQHFPFAKQLYRNYLPFYRKAIESLDLSRFDLIVSSSSSVAKGVKKKPGQIHVCYCHTPIRYAWDLQDQYLELMNPMLKPFTFYIKYELAKLRKWDLETQSRVDHFLASSGFIAERIKRIYNRDAKVVYPPVDTDSFALAPKPRKDFYVTAGRLVPYKKMHVIAEAFRMMPDKKLFIIGDGPDRNAVKKYCNDNIVHLGYQPKDRMVKYIQEAKAFVLAAEEDFGITTVEAEACGTPIIAYKKGGYLETVVDGKTGVFFEHQTAKEIKDAVLQFESKEQDFLPDNIREQALKFAEKKFNSNFVKEVKRILHEKRGNAS
ncbi:MAG: glycosyltransferase [Bacteroidota bacterium]|jgi:glycosyltransferase involved in cell wall biosynthesis|nr:glycosyltransferase [Sphingobacteriales bacterium]